MTERKSKNPILVETFEEYRNDLCIQLYRIQFSFPNISKNKWFINYDEDAGICFLPKALRQLAYKIQKDLEKEEEK